MGGGFEEGVAGGRVGWEGGRWGGGEVGRGGSGGWQWDTRGAYIIVIDSLL